LTDILFSIVLPTYNRAELLDNAIQSVLEQEYTNFELLIVDDGSTDNTKTLVNQIKDGRIKYYYKKNEERNIARNYGVSMARGHYISFLDSDDILYKNHLFEAKKLIKDIMEPEVIHLNYEIIGLKREASLITKKNIKKANKPLIYDNILQCNSIFIRRDIAKEYRFLNSSNAIVGEDYYLWLKLACRFEITVSPVVTNAIIEHKQRSLRDINLQKFELGTNEIINALKEDKEFRSYYRHKADRYFANRFILLALYLSIGKKKKLAIKYLRKAFSESPTSVFSWRFITVLRKIITS